MASGKENNDDNGFFNPFAGLKKNLPAPAKSGGNPDPDSGKKGPGGKPGKPAGSAPAAKRQDFAAQNSRTAQDAEDSAMFLAAMQTTPRYVQSYSSADESDGAEPSMAELLAEAEKSATRPAGRAPAAQQPPDQTPPRPAPKKSPAPHALRAPAPEAPPQLSGEDAQSFAEAMRGVRPVDGKGRDLAPAAKPAPQKVQVELDYLTEFTQGKYEFALEYTEEFFEGHVMGLDPLVVSKIRAGQYSAEAHLDLHGLNADQAYAALLDFVRHSYNQGRRALVVVTGRGKNSPGGFAVLRQHMQDWLTKDPLKRVVLAFCTAQPKDGGAGALYVMLRKLKKGNGKIRWER